MYLSHGNNSSRKEQSYHNSSMVIGIHNIYKKQLFLKGLASQMGETNISFTLVLIQAADFWARTKSQPIKQLSLLIKSASLILLGISYPYITELYCIFYFFSDIMPLFLTLSSTLLITLTAIKICRAKSIT